MADFKAKILAFRGEKGMSRRAFGDALGVPESKIQKIELGKQRADHEFLAALSSVFDADLNWLLSENTDENGGVFPTSGQNEGTVFHTPEDFVQIPRYDIAASAGHGTMIDGENTTASYAFTRSWIERRGLSANSLAVVSVSGDSMLPDLHDGDLILVDQDQAQPRDGYMYAVRYSGDLFVKRVQRLPGERALLLSANKSYPPIMVDDEGPDSCKVIGRVVASMHQW